MLRAEVQQLLHNPPSCYRGEILRQAEPHKLNLIDTQIKQYNGIVDGKEQVIETTLELYYECMTCSDLLGTMMEVALDD